MQIRGWELREGHVNGPIGFPTCFLRELSPRDRLWVQEPRRGRKNSIASLSRAPIDCEIENRDRYFAFTIIYADFFLYRFGKIASERTLLWRPVSRDECESRLAKDPLGNVLFHVDDSRFWILVFGVALKGSPWGLMTFGEKRMTNEVTQQWVGERVLRRKKIDIMNHRFREKNSTSSPAWNGPEQSRFILIIGADLVMYYLWPCCAKEADASCWDYKNSSSSLFNLFLDFARDFHR